MRYFRESKISYITGIICVSLLFICTSIVIYVSYSNYVNGPVISDEVQLIERDKYTIDIKYPVLKNNEINKDIKDFIRDEKKLFKDSIKDIDTYENELNISYNYSIKDSLYSIYIKSYSYIGKNNKYTWNDKIIYYDSKLNKEIYVSNIIIDNKFYEVLRNNCYDYLINNKDKYKVYDSSIIRKRLIAIDSNYELISFNKDSIEVIFEPHSVSDFDNEIIVKIDYNYVINYLNSNYFSIYDTEKEMNTGNVEKKYNRIRDSKDFENKKLIALTFDDGPAYAKTDKLITELDKRNARVTFFMLGQLAIKQKDLVKKVYDHGHTIGSHTYDHKNLKKLDDDKLKFEIDYTNEILSNIIGEEIRFVRPPYGSYNQDILSKVNMAFILWNVDTLDWKLRDAEKVRDYIVEHAKDGDIILLHDIHSTSVDGVIMAIDILKNEGYEFVSLDEMLVYKNINIQYNKAYRFFK